MTTAKPLSLTTHLAEPQNFGVTSTLISGEKDAILVNAQFTRSEALRVAADILDSGKNLTTIFAAMVIQIIILVCKRYNSFSPTQKLLQRQLQ